MLVSNKELSELLTAAWDAAQDCSYELKDQIIYELLFSFQTAQTKPWQILKTEEWLGLPSGHKIFHSLFGEGSVGIKGNERFISFRGFRMEFTEPGWPWDQPTQLL